MDPLISNSTTEIRQQHQFDIDRLRSYLSQRLPNLFPKNVDDFMIRQFKVLFIVVLSFVMYLTV
jgi:hypothetical protein